jgi:hypothetical protein
MLEGKLSEAMKMTTQSDALFTRTIGADKGFMAKYYPHFSRFPTC